MKEIKGEARSISGLLTGTRYSIDYYQREYKWQTKQVRELLQDLTEKFLEDYKPTDERPDVQKYGNYFLGSIIISRKNGQSFIIDGQQRLTTLTLLLIYLHNLQDSRPDRVKLDHLIFSEKYAKKSFNIDVDDRTPCMEALFKKQPFDPTEKPESIRNIVGCYNDFCSDFPEEIDEKALPFFCDWLIENVYLVEITAYSDEDAYTIFETMNDRGLSLTPVEMLKGYLLANITDEEHKVDASNTWKQRVGALVDFGKDEDADAFKSWLRSQFAETIRERKKGAKPEEFDRLGTEFHRWIRENDKRIGLNVSSDFARFIEQDMNFYTRQYPRLREASINFVPGLEVIYYNACLDFTLQYPLLLASLLPSEDEATINRKLRVVGSFIDILVVRRLWNFRLIAYSTMQYAMFLVMRDIRRKSLPELVSILNDRLAQEKETFASDNRLRVYQLNRKAIHIILARITDHIERKSGMTSHFVEYVSEGKNRYEIEHIWADHPEQYVDEFPHPADFAEYRNHIGGLLLLPKSFNASFGDLPYMEKLEHYNSQNLLARTLHEKCYEMNPGFLKYMEQSKLPFSAHPSFKKADLDARQTLYLQIAEEIWNPARLKQEAGL